MLEEGNIALEISGKLTRSQKHNILENMAAVMYNFKPYRSYKDVGMAAEALVTAHPCLKEPGSVTGWYGWKKSLKFKMGDYRGKLSRSGCLGVSVNAGKRSKNNPDKEHPHSNIKRARRTEVNFLPNFPKGESQASLEEMRLQIMDEVEKSQQNLRLIEMLMQITFALRRQEIIQENPQVKDFLGKWPTLRIESQVKHRLCLSLFCHSSHIFLGQILNIYHIQMEQLMPLFTVGKNYHFACDHVSQQCILTEHVASQMCFLLLIEY